ncbi:hypothetical protein FRB93_004686 [Tulasnella sp. JGI-2019a]|nr:hypothetical protein FRB93_004686 [Tulasnella sp. JGI-2019a]
MPPIPQETSPAERWIDIQDDDLTVEIVEELLEAITDDLWVVAACVDRVVDDIQIQRCIVQTGIARTEKTVLLAQEVVKELEGDAGGEHEELSEDTSATPELDDDIRELLVLRRMLLRRSDDLHTYEEMASKSNWSLGPADRPDETPVSEELDDLDPWAEGNDEAPVLPSVSPSSPPPFTLTSFLLAPALETALLLASSLQIPALAVLFVRRTDELLPHRLKVFDAIPLYAQSSEKLNELLPSFDYQTSQEKLPSQTPWREIPDWTEADGMTLVDAGAAIIHVSTFESLKTLRPEPLSAEELSSWYLERAKRIDLDLGLVDVALALVQHGASQGIPGLDGLGEELSLLSRLVYDAGSTGTSTNWNLERWRSMDTESIIQAYLSASTPSNVAGDIRRLVLPYLYVLEAHKERAGSPDPSLPKRYLFKYLLAAPLSMAAAIFEASKPTLPAGQRLIQKDDDMARLALACLYGSDALNEWSTMSRIFECLPAWQSANDQAAEGQGGTADATLRTLATFVAPSATRPKVSPQDLLSYFEPLNTQALSRMLDVLDVHLTSGEILSRWDVPAPLRWFVQSANDEAQQRAWATRMARRNVASEDVEEDGNEWVQLMKEMTRLVGGGEGALKGAFGLLSKDEVRKIFFEGLLSLGKFKLARRLLNPKHGHRPLTPGVIEGICLSMSREFYDNASSGNLHVGEMKLAYDCLAVVIPPTPATIAEREFIEATSKICSYGVHSRPGVPLAPIEIRLVKDRLSLISRVLSSNENVYKHSEVVLDIVHKLGFRNDLAAEVKTLAMLADAATQAEDFVRAAEMSERMVKDVQALRRMTFSTSSSDSARAMAARDEAIEVCWHTCFQLGRQPEYPDAKRKLGLLAHAVQLCPSENVLDVLAIWRRVEGEAMDSATLPSPGGRGRWRGSGARAGDQNRRGTRLGVSGSLQAAAGQIPSLSARLVSMNNAAAAHLGPISSDMASKTLNRMAGVAANLPSNLPFSLRGRLGGDDAASSGRSSPTGRSQSSDVSHQAKAAFARGVGWLIGVDDE